MCKLLGVSGLFEDFHCRGERRRSGQREHSYAASFVDEYPCPLRQCGVVYELDSRVGRVVRGRGSRRRDLATHAQVYRPNESLDLLLRDGTNAQDGRTRGGAVDDRGLDANATRSVIDHEVDVIAEISSYMLGGGRAHTSESVRRRRRNATAELIEQRQRDTLVGYTQRDLVPAASDFVRHELGTTKHKGQRPRPARVR